MRITWDQVRARIASSVAIERDGCWNWQKAIRNDGYGRALGEMAHRLSYLAHVGPIGKGLDLDHLCRNRSCVNPAHLEPVTRKENLRRGVGIQLQKERAAARSKCSSGHDLTIDNLYIRPSDGARLCRECRRIQDIKDRSRTRDIRNMRKREKRRAIKMERKYYGIRI